MKDSFIFEGKKYISAKRASEISSYASDYVGQLCRAGKLDCRMVGRSWFVTEESLHLHKAAISREEGQRSRIENLRGKTKLETKIVEVVSKDVSNQNSKQIVSETPVVKKEIIVYQSGQNLVEPSKINLNQNKNEIKDFISSELKKKSVSPWTVEDLSIKSPYVYSSDDRPLLPELKKKDFKEQKNKIEENKIDSPIKVIKEKEFVTEQKNISSVENGVQINKAETKIEKEKIIVNEFVKNTEKKVVGPIVKKETVESFKKARKQFSENLITYERLARRIILQRVIVPVVVLAIFFGLGTGTYILGSNVVENIYPEVNKIAVVAKVNAGNVFNSVFDSLSNGYKSVVSFFTSPARLALNNDKHFGDVTVSEVTPNGIVITSSTGSNEEDEEVKQKIRGSFSDEVKISEDDSGTAGVITPIFKDTKGKDFIYVMVPVKENSSETKK